MHKFYTIFFILMSMLWNVQASSSEDSWDELSDEALRKSTFDLSYDSSEDTSVEYILSSSDEFTPPSDLSYSSSEEELAKPISPVDLGLTISPQTRVKKIKKEELMYKNKEIPAVFPKKAQSPIAHGGKDLWVKPAEITALLPKKIQTPIAQYFRTHQIKLVETDESSTSESSGHGEILSLSSDSMETEHP